MTYTQQEQNLDTIRRRWCGLNANDIALTDAQRQIVTDFEVLLEAYEELASPGPYKDPDELTDLLRGLTEGKWDRDDVVVGCNDLSSHYENAGHVQAMVLIDELTQHLKRLAPRADGDVEGFPPAVARAIALLWDCSESEHRAEFVCEGYRVWLSLPTMSGVNPGGVPFTLTARDVEKIRAVL